MRPILVPLFAAVLALGTAAVAAAGHPYAAPVAVNQFAFRQFAVVPNYYQPPLVASFAPQVFVQPSYAAFAVQPSYCPSAALVPSFAPGYCPSAAFAPSFYPQPAFFQPSFSPFFGRRVGY